MSGVGCGFAPFEVPLSGDRLVRVRAAVPGDAQAVLDYMHEVLPEVQEYILTTPEEFCYTLEEERSLIAGSDPARGEVWLLACHAGRVVGLMNCGVSSRRRLAHVGGLGMTLHEGFRGGGLGEAMMGALIDWAVRHPVLELLQLEVYADNPRALALYRKAGFVEGGRTPGRTRFGPGVYKDEVAMWRDVRNAEQKAETS